MQDAPIGPLFKKSYYRERPGKIWSFYCPLCRAPRKVGVATRPRPVHYLQLVLVTGVVTLATWRWIEWKGVVTLFPLWMGFEALYRLRARTQLHCDQCGFDPYLYLVDIQRARSEIQDHWRVKFAQKGIPFPGDPVASETGIAAPTAISSDNKEKSPPGATH